MYAGNHVDEQDKQMSELSPKQQLMIARQQLDKLSIFIAGLADFFRGTSPVIDAEFQQIKTLLSGKPDYEKAVELATGLNAKLKKESKFMQQKNADTLLQIQGSLRNLVGLDVIDSEVKQEIKHFISSLVPNKIDKDSPLGQFEKTLTLFKKALNNNLVVSKQKDTDELQHIHQQIIQELRDLIAPFYHQNTNDKTLVEINQKLNDGLGQKELLQCCLIVIRFAIKYLLREASSATKLINNIHKSLVKINQGIHTTINKSKSRLQTRHLETTAMKAQILAMENAISSSENIVNLKAQSSEYLAKLQNSLDLIEQQDRGEQQKVIALLQSMQKRLYELENQSDTYKQKLMEQRINAMTDTLTKLPNRIAYEEKVNNEWRRLRNEKKVLYLAIFDIDNFKQINDKYGHSVGDKTLQIIANHIRKLIDKNDFLVRWGGEEFVALLYDQDLNSSFAKVEALREKIASLPFMFKGARVSVTISIGLSEFGTQSTIEEAFEAADNLLFSAKNNGRNQTCIRG